MKLDSVTNPEQSNAYELYKHKRKIQQVCTDIHNTTHLAIIDGYSLIKISPDLFFSICQDIQSKIYMFDHTAPRLILEQVQRQLNKQ